MLIDRIKQLSEDYFGEILETRRHLHQNPELSFQEFETAGFIETQLKTIGIRDFRRIADTGITFTIQGNNPGKTVALRADIDALPIHETNETSYRSQNAGVMHACGHDVHTSCLLGAIRILDQLKEEFNGTVKVIFQPGEEKIPGGASLLIKEGVLKSPKPDKILGQHVMPLIPVGKVGFRPGMYMASADEIYLTVQGKGGHAAMPENLVDPIAISSQVISSLQQVVSRKSNPRIPSVLSFGKIIGEGATNVIPDEVYIEGTFRTFDEEWRNRAHDIIRNIAAETAKAFGGECKVDIKKGYPFLINEEKYTQQNIESARKYLGEENVIDLDIWMAAEDFAYYSHEVDACFYRLGTRNESKGIVSGVHTSTFDIDEDALKIGMGLMAWLTMEELNRS